MGARPCRSGFGFCFGRGRCSRCSRGCRFGGGGPGRRLGQRGGAGEGVAAAGGVGGGVAGGHLQALLGADVHAVAALDAVEPLDGPGAGGPIHRQGAGGTAAGAQAAADAGLDVDFDVPPHPLGVLGRRKGIAGGHRFAEQVFQRRARKGNKFQ